MDSPSSTLAVIGSVLLVAAGCTRPSAADPAPVAVAPAPVATRPTVVPADPVAVTEDTCFAVPVTFDDDFAGAKPVDPTLDEALAECTTAAEPNTCAFRIAREYVNANRFELAGPIFVRIALDPNPGPLGAPAAQFAFDCQYLLAAHASSRRAVCFEEMQALIPKLQTRYCETDEPARDPYLCPLLERFSVDVVRKTADDLAARAQAKAGPDAQSLYRQAAETYRALFDEHCRLDASGRNARGKKPSSALRCDELIYNTYVLWRVAGEETQAEAAKAAMLDPQNGLADSELTKRLEAQP